jgi:hypothetical protein
MDVLKSMRCQKRQRWRPSTALVLAIVALAAASLQGAAAASKATFVPDGPVTGTIWTTAPSNFVYPELSPGPYGMPSIQQRPQFGIAVRVLWRCSDAPPAGSGVGGSFADAPPDPPHPASTRPPGERKQVLTVNTAPPPPTPINPDRRRRLPRHHARAGLGPRSARPGRAAKGPLPLVQLGRQLVQRGVLVQQGLCVRGEEGRLV